MKLTKFLLILLFVQSFLFAQDKRKVGLIPFKNETGSQKYDWISYGFEYYLYNKLSVLSGFYVPDKKVFHAVLNEVGYGKAPLNGKMIYHIGRTSQVEVAVAGSYKLEDGRILLQVEFFNALTGGSLLVSQFNEPISKFFVLGRKIVEQLINLSGITVSPSEQHLLNFTITRSITAYGSFVRAYMESEAAHPKKELITGLFRKAIREDNKFWEAYYNLGIVYFNSGQYNLALQQFNRVITALPNFDKPYFGRGLIFEKQKKYDQAIADFKKVAEFNPNDYKAFYYLGKISIINKEYEEAKKYLKTARKLNPEYAPTFYESGNIYYNQDRYRKCIEYYKKAAKLDNENALYHLKLGDAYYRSQIYYNALNEIDMAIALRPNNANAYFLRGITIYKQAVLQELVKAFLDLLNNKPQKKANSGTNFSKKAALDPVKQKQVYDDMAAAFLAAIRVRPTFMESTFNLALTYHEAGNYTEAEKYYLRTLQLNPNLVRARLKLADLYTQTNRKKEAIEQYRQIFYIAPSIFVHHPTLGPEHQYINVFNKFRKELEEQIQREPNSPKYNLILAKVFQAQGQYGKAANLARKVLTFSPNNVEARKILAQIEQPGRY